MDDKTKNDQQESNEDKDELELFTRNTSKKRRQRKRSKATHFSNQNKDDTSQQADFDEEIYLINKDFKRKAMMKIMILLLVMRMIIISMILQTLILKMRIIDILKKLTTKMNRMELQSTTNNINQLLMNKNSDSNDEETVTKKNEK